MLIQVYQAGKLVGHAPATYDEAIALRSDEVRYYRSRAVPYLAIPGMKAGTHLPSGVTTLKAAPAGQIQLADTYPVHVISGFRPVDPLAEAQRELREAKSLLRRTRQNFDQDAPLRRDIESFLD